MIITMIMKCKNPKCEYEWESRKPNPKCCPMCKRYLVMQKSQEPQVIFPPADEGQTHWSIQGVADVPVNMLDDNNSIPQSDVVTLSKTQGHFGEEPESEDSPSDEEPMTKEDKLANARLLQEMVLSGAQPSTLFSTEPEEENWIEDPPTFENGQKLYWHHRPKEKPVCYKQETDYDNSIA